MQIFGDRPNFTSAEAALYELDVIHPVSLRTPLPLMPRPDDDAEARPPVVRPLPPKQLTEEQAKCVRVSVLGPPISDPRK